MTTFVDPEYRGEAYRVSEMQYCWPRSSAWAQPNLCHALSCTPTLGQVLTACVPKLRWSTALMYRFHQFGLDLTVFLLAYTHGIKKR